MHQKNIIKAGRKITKDSRVLILLHGRGGSANDIITLADHLPVADYSLLAPQATQHTWYPYSFLAPKEANEPWLSSALSLLKEMVDDLYSDGLGSSQIYFLGFSQGACLTLEFVCRNARRYGGVIAFTGGLIGEQLVAENYQGDFEGTPIFLGSSDPDIHVPVERVEATGKILSSMQAELLMKIFPGMGHTITDEEIRLAIGHVFSRNL